ncbi:hypothetical protein [Streptomyces sp. BPTC-684]|uniref:hypothetical protein n=1 Tax=Streptomyces sp. BPTC-684 TaxID=3043734 RepID=UPI0024B1D163|nr:hypothetical protein [Streptomyces sp. BPTC-684]WHM38536.1 hypothetical protein QIY60_17540 [Streptomyces sp. BPTC-684]
MLPSTHLTLHEIRAAELRKEAADYALIPRDRHRMRTQVGLKLVELGTRLAQPPARHRHRTRIA